MKIITAEQVNQYVSFEKLVPLLYKTFSQNFTMPQRKVYHLDNNPEVNDAFALLPSWNEEVIGTKAFTYFPDNKAEQGLASLYSKIMLFKRETGEPLALVDGTSITYWRTAAISALASQLLSKENSKSLLLFGTGNLAPFLIRAHLTVRDLSHVTIAARHAEKAQALIGQLDHEFPHVNFTISQDLKADVEKADVIVCATGSPTPLFDGNWLSPGCHVDCLGNHNTDRRECDSITVSRARVFVDSLENNLAEAGELLLPIAAGEFSKNDIVGELAALCREEVTARQSANEITLFKSVGTAISDLVTANDVYQQVKGSYEIS